MYIGLTTAPNSGDSSSGPYPTVIPEETGSVASAPTSGFLVPQTQGKTCCNGGWRESIMEYG